MASLPGGREFTNAEHRREVAEILGIDAARIPTANSLCYDQILDGIRAGRIRGLWVIATNTAHSWIDQNGARELLQKLDFLVVQDMYRTTETAQAAHLVLPAAGWGEKDGTLINSERRIGLVKKVARAPGHALADFSIFQLVAHHWGCSQMFAGWTDPEAVFLALASWPRCVYFDSAQRHATLGRYSFVAADPIEWFESPDERTHHAPRDDCLTRSVRTTLHQ